MSATALTILAADARAGWNLVRRGQGAGRRRVVALMAGVVVAVPFTAGAFVGSYAAARAGVDPGPVLGAAFTSMVGVILVLDASTVITAFFADRALILLALAPVRARDVFLARLVSASIPAWLVALVGFAVVVGFGAGLGAGAAYYVTAAVAVVVTVVTTVSLLVAALSVVLRVVPARRARDVANLLVAMLGVALWVGWYGFGGGGGRSLGQGVRPLTTAARNLAALPTSWPGSVLTAIAAGDPGAALARLALLLAVSAVVIGAAWLAYRRAFAVGVGVYGEGGAVRRQRPARTRTAAPGSGPARPVRALVHKDLVTMRRDMKRLARVLPAVAMAIAYPILLRGPSAAQGAGRLDPDILFWISAGGALFVPFMTSMVIALPAVGLEGRAMRLLLLSGTAARTVVRAKLTLAVALIAAMGGIGGIITALLRGVHDGRVLVLLLALLAFSAGMAAIGVGAGALAPNFETDDPRRAVRFEGTVICFAADIAFTGLCVGALVLSLIAVRQPAPLPLAAATLLALLAAVIPVLLVTAGTRSLASWRPDPDA